MEKRKCHLKDPLDLVLLAKIFTFSKTTIPIENYIWETWAWVAFQILIVAKPSSNVTP